MKKKERNITDVCLYQNKFIKSLKFDVKGAEQFLNNKNIPKDRIDKSKSAINRFKNNNHIAFRTNNNRVFNSFTNLHTPLRSFLDGDFVSIDCANSQPFTLILEAYNENQCEKELLDLACAGKLYESFNGNRAEVKKSFYPMLFNNKGININNPIYKQINKRFPIFGAYILELSNKKDYSLAEYLQKKEAEIWIDKVSNNLMLDNIKHFTIHDSVVVRIDDLQYAYNVVCNAFGETQPTYHIVNLKTGKDIKVKESKKIKKDYKKVYEDYTFTYNFNIFTIGRYKTKKGELVDYVKIDNSNVIKYMTHMGVRNWNDNGREKYIIIKNNVIDTVTVSDIKQMIYKHLDEMDYTILNNTGLSLKKRFSNGNTFVNKNSTYDYFPSVKSEDISSKLDTKDACYFPFLNGILRVEKSARVLIPYNAINGFIWADNIKNVNYKSVEFSESIIKDLYSKVIVDTDEYMIERIIGYLLHTYKHRAITKHIVFLDNDFENDNRGGSGKSIIAQIIGMLRNVIIIDAKKDADNKQLGAVTLATDIILFDDLKQFSDFEELNNMVTGDLEIDAKYGSKFTIPFLHAPKIVSTSNYMIDKSNSGVSRRTLLIETTDFFNSNHTPIDEYGKQLIVDWDETEMNREINYLVDCASKYLEFGLPDVSITNEKEKLMKYRVGDDYKTAFDYLTSKGGNLMITAQAFKSVMREQLGYGIDDRKSILLTNKKLEEYCKINGYTLTKNVTEKIEGKNCKVYRIKINSSEVYQLWNNLDGYSSAEMKAI